MWYLVDRKNIMRHETVKYIENDWAGKSQPLDRRDYTEIKKPRYFYNDVSHKKASA